MQMLNRRLLDVHVQSGKALSNFELFSTIFIGTFQYWMNNNLYILFILFCLPSLIHFFTDYFHHHGFIN